MKDIPQHQFDDSAITLATLTLVQMLMVRLRENGVISDDAFKQIVDDAIRVNEAASTEEVIEVNKKAALLLRAVFSGARA